MTIDGIDKTTGEIMKPYETPDHNNFGKAMLRQYKYMIENVKSEEGVEFLSGKSGDQLVEIMITLVGFYEELGKWLADEKLRLADMKTALELKFAKEYIAFKQEEKQTNETARMSAKIACADEQELLDRTRHTWDRVHNWKKSIGRYHDSVKTQLGYEKSLTYMARH